MEQDSNQSSPYLSIEEAADYLRLKKGTLYSYVHQRRIVYRKHGSKLIFIKKDLDAFSQSGEHKLVLRSTLSF